MQEDKDREQAFLPGFEIRRHGCRFCLERALEFDCREVVAYETISRVRLISITINTNDGNGTEISIDARSNAYRYFKRHFYPLERGALIRSLRFQVWFTGNVPRIITLYPDRVSASGSEFAEQFKRFLVANGVAYAEDAP